jgi:hypothetical protein
MLIKKFFMKLISLFQALKMINKNVVIIKVFINHEKWVVIIYSVKFFVLIEILIICYVYYFLLIILSSLLESNQN